MRSEPQHAGRAPRDLRDVRQPPVGVTVQGNVTFSAGDAVFTSGVDVVTSITWAPPAGSTLVVWTQSTITTIHAVGTAPRSVGTVNLYDPTTNDGIACEHHLATTGTGVDGLIETTMLSQVLANPRIGVRSHGISATFAWVVVIETP